MHGEQGEQGEQKSKWTGRDFLGLLVAFSFFVGGMALGGCAADAMYFSKQFSK